MTIMPTILHSISPFLSTGAAVPEPNRTKPKQCSFSHLQKSSGFSFPRKKSLTIFAWTHNTNFPNVTTLRLPKWKLGTKIIKNKLLDAFLHFEEMVKKGHAPDPSEVNDLLLDLWKEGMLLKSVRVMVLILESNSVPYQFTRTFMIESLANMGAYEYAIKLLDKMLDRGLTLESRAYQTLTISLCSRAYTRQSFCHLEKLINKDVFPCCTFDLATVLEAASDEKGADGAISVMYQILKKGSPTPNIVCYNVVLSALCKENRVSDALELFEAILSRVRPSLISYNILLKGLCNDDRWQDAEKLLREIMEKGRYPRHITYKGFIQVLANKGYAEEALKIAELLAKNGFRIDPWCFNPIIAQFCLENRIDMVYRVLKIMEKVNCVVNEGTYLAICGLCRQDNLDGAFNILENIRTKQKLSLHMFYMKVFPYLCRKGSTFEAIQILNKLNELDFIPRSATISSLARGLCREEMLEEAMEMFELREKNGIRSEVLNYNKLILGLCRAGRVDLALIVHERMILRGYEPNENTYLYIVEGIANQDRRDLAKELLRELLLRNLVSEKVVEKICLKFCLVDV